MMGFREFLAERNLARAGAVTIYAGRARQYGEKSKQDFQSGRSLLAPTLPDNKSEERLKRIEKVLDKLLSGMINQRQQIGNHVAVSTSGHLFASDLLKRRNRRR